MTKQTMIPCGLGASTMRLMVCEGTEAARQEIREAADFYEVMLRAQWREPIGRGAQNGKPRSPVREGGGEPTATCGIIPGTNHASERLK